MARVKDYLKKVPGLDWIAKTNKRIYDLEQKTLKLESDLADTQEQLNKVTGEVILSKKEKLNKIAVFTALIGNYDELNDPIRVENDFCDYYCFTDNEQLKSDVWKIVYVKQSDYSELKGLDKVKFARYIKTHPHTFLKEYKHTIFIDANLTIRKSLIAWYCLYSNGNGILTFKHPDRDCVYDEEIRCKEMNKDNPVVMDKQISRYRKEGYPKHNGLVMTNLMYRENNKEVNNFNEKWWKEIKKESRRDQLSFNYVQWKTKIDVDLCPLHAAFNDYFIYNYHPNQNKNI